MSGNTVLLIIAMLILLAIATFLIGDYYLAWSDQATFSEKCFNTYIVKMNNPQFFLLVGTITGFIIGLIAGFVLGHLFWPQFPREG